MKLIPTIALTVTLLASSQVFADSKRTAEFLLSDPKPHQDQQVTLDVAFVKPVHWKSPLPEIAFFHAITMDRTDRKPGGSILVAVPAEESAKFAKKYGMDFDGRSDMTTLRGTFMVSGGKKEHGRPGIWLVDSTGKLASLLEQRKLDLPDEKIEGGGAGPDGPGGPGVRPRPRRPL